MRGYHHGDLRRALLETAVALAREEGPDGVVLREAARRTGVSHNAAYRHFADRDELMTAVGEWGMDQLNEAMERRIETVRTRDPGLRARRRLGEVGRAYVHFALEEPGLFAVAFAGKEAPSAADEVGPYALLCLVLDEMVDVGVLTKSRRVGADAVCWAAVHGFAVLHLTGPLRQVPAEVREQSLDKLLATVQRGLTSA